MELNIRQIIKMLPHRYPFLLVDKVISCVPGKSIIALKNVTFNEPFFMGHFPSNPIMPGVLIIESMAQACAICVISAFETNNRESIVYLTSIENARFKRVVSAGDVLKLKCEVLKSRRNFYKFSCTGYVEEELTTESIITAIGSS